MRINDKSKMNKHKFNFFRLLLCYNYFPALAIQISSFILSILGIFLIKLGLLKIPFYVDAYIYKFFFHVNIPYFLLIFLFNLTFLIFRCTHLMNNDLNLWGFGLSIIEVYVAIFGIITNLINESMIIYNIKDYKKLAMEKKSNKVIKNDQLIYTKIILPGIIIIWLNILLLSISDLILINLKIDGSYNNYRLSMEIEKQIVNEEINKNQKRGKKKKKEKNPKDKKPNYNNKSNTNAIQESVIQLNDNNSIVVENNGENEEKNKNDIFKYNNSKIQESDIKLKKGKNSSNKNDIESKEINKNDSSKSKNKETPNNINKSKKGQNIINKNGEENDEKNKNDNNLKISTLALIENEDLNKKLPENEENKV